MKLAIGIPTTGLIKAQTMLCIFRMIRRLKCEYDLLIKEGSILHWNRESLAQTAIETKCTHLLFVDSDMVFGPEAVIQLLRRDKDIVGINANLRRFPLTSTVRMSAEQKAKVKELNGFLTCDAVGLGFTLIKIEVFKNLPHPWFFWKSNEKGEVEEGEDSWFCRQAKEKGYEIWVDLTIPVKHIGDFLF